MSNLLGKLVCWFMGHKRGRRLFAITPNEADGQRSKTHIEIRVYCPRCLYEWTRKVKVK